MTHYARAYRMDEIRRFEGWTEPDRAAGERIDDAAVVYLWDDYRLVLSPVSADQGVLRDEDTPAWRAFCETRLGFAVPEEAAPDRP